jgi:hypothetical protein
MARFRGTISGQRGEASRLGSPQSGLSVHANGWDAGVSVNAYVDEHDADVFDVRATAGSGGQHTSVPIARVTYSKEDGWNVMLFTDNSIVRTENGE